MKLLSTFKIELCEFWCPKDILNDVKELAQNIKWVQNRSNKISEERNFVIPKFDEWLLDCLNDVKKNFYPDLEADLVPYSTWMTKTSPTEFHHKHCHPNAIVSGILYFNTFENCNPTIFYLKNPWWELQNSGLFKLVDDVNWDPKEITYEVLPEEGKMIIFPAQLIHSTAARMVKQDRYTLVFNTFLKGSIGTSYGGSKITISY